MEEQRYVVGIGSSAGGVEALIQFFRHVPVNTGCTFVVVSHLPIDIPTILHSILKKFTSMPVDLLEANIRPESNHVYLLPGHLRVSVKNGELRIRKRLDTEIINTAVDEFLLSLADDQKGNAIAIILSGTGQDGAIGAKRVHENSGFVIVQDPATSDFVGMPLAAIRADHPDEILSPARLGDAFLYLLETKRHVRFATRNSVT